MTRVSTSLPLLCASWSAKWPTFLIKNGNVLFDYKSGSDDNDNHLYWGEIGGKNWTGKLDRQIGQANLTGKLDRQVGHAKWTGRLDNQIGQANWTGK
jgi:hypothetical protein